MGKPIQTQIDINAPAGVVWRVLTDLAGYEKWNPFVRWANGVIALGETLRLKPTMPTSGKKYDFTAKVTTCNPETEFAWTGHQIHPAVISGEHLFKLEPLNENATRLRHDELFTGLLAPLVMAVGGKETQRAFEMMNEATRQEAERRVGENGN